VLEFDTEAARASYIRQRGWDAPAGSHED
jgi:hypothetical protein